MNVAIVLLIAMPATIASTAPNAMFWLHGTLQSAFVSPIALN